MDQGSLIKNFIVIISMLFFFAGCNQVETEGYIGDGNIQPAGSGYFSKGYKIVFENFSLQNSFWGKYKIDNLPKTNKTCWVGLEISSEVSNFLEFCKGDLSIQVQTSDQTKLFRCSAPLSQWRHSQIKLGENRFQNFIYYLDDANESSFSADQLISGKGLIEVKWVSYPGSKRLDADVVLKSGGTK